MERHYQCMALSTGHLTTADHIALIKESQAGNNRILVRETGLFVKLALPQQCKTNDYEAHIQSELGLFNASAKDASFTTILRYALDNGLALIEFDSDTDTTDFFKLHRGFDL